MALLIFDYLLTFDAEVPSVQSSMRPHSVDNTPLRSLTYGPRGLISYVLTAFLHKLRLILRLQGQSALLPRESGAPAHPQQFLNPRPQNRYIPMLDLITLWNCE